MGITIDDEMGKRIQMLSQDKCPVLFFLLPQADSQGSNDADNYHEVNTVVLFVMSRYDPQRKTAIEVIEAMQPVMEAVKAQLMADALDGCPVLERVDVASFTTMPESGFYKTLAGWSLGFTIRTFGL